MTKKVQKSNFFKYKKVFQIDNIDVTNTLISKNESFNNKNSLKYFIIYNDNDIIRPFCIKNLHK